MTAPSPGAIGIIGAGTMGQGIAQVCVSYNYPVLVYDTKPGVAGTALENIGRNLTLLQEKGKISAEEKDNMVSNLRSTLLLSQFSHCSLVIEAAVEDLAVKHEIFSQLEHFVTGDCLLVTNTSSISIDQIADALQNKGRFAGLHFFNPAQLMKLVEIVKGKETTDDTVKLLFDFCQKIQKHAVLTQDSPGFIVNRVARHYYVEPLKMLEDKVADYKTIDTLMKATGFRLGPFELMDLIGIDVNLSVTKSIYNAFQQEPRFKPSMLQQQKVDSGELGRKTGRGFYAY